MPMRRKNCRYLEIVLLFLILISLIDFSSALRINEIMYNPNQCDDNYCEWVELYNEGSDADITNWTLCGKKVLAGYVNRSGAVLSDETLTIPSGGYAVITDGGTGTEVYSYFSVSGISLHVDANSTCGGLSAGKTIFLNGSSGALISSALINSSAGADNNGKSLQFNGTEWLEALPTPGALNVFPVIEINETANLTKTNETNTTSPIIADNISSSETQGYDYSVIEYPSELKENFSVKVRIENNENETDFEIWSYVYSGSKCYSVGGREANNISITISKGDSKTIELYNQINFSEIESGKDYSLKIKILRQGLKTPKEFTFQLAANLSVQPENETVGDNASEENEAEPSPAQPKTIAENKDKSTENVLQIESKSETINDTAVYIFAGILMLLSIYLILKKG